MARACTINEPNWVATNGYILAMWPPGEQDYDKGKRASDTLVDAHRKAVAAIRAAAPDVPVGLTMSMTDFQAVEGGEARLQEIRRPMEDVYLEGTEGEKDAVDWPRAGGRRMTEAGWEACDDPEAMITYLADVVWFPN